MKRAFDLGDCLDGAQISLAYAARRAEAETTTPAPPPPPPPPPDAMAALMARIERAETAIETLTRTVQALVGPERATTPKPEEPKEPEAEAEDNPELLPTFASEAPTSSETPPRCATPDPLDMLSPEQAMLASLLNVGALGSGTVVVAPQPAPPPLLQPPPPQPVPPRPLEATPTRGSPGILSEYGGIKGWMATRDKNGGS